MSDSQNPKAPGEPGKAKKELSMEQRLLLAFLLMGAVLFLTPYFMPKPTPKPPQKTPAPPAQKSAESKPVQKPASRAAPAPASVGQVSDNQERQITVNTDLYEIRFSNRGAVAKSWQLKKYKDNLGKALDLVNPVSVEKAGAAPFTLAFTGQKPAADLGQALYAAKTSPDGLTVEFEFSDGRTLSRKSFQFKKDSYLATFISEASGSGAALPHLVSWRGGFGDATVPKAYAAQHSLYYDSSNSKLVINDHTAGKDGPVSAGGAFLFAGLEDAYFAAVFLPEGTQHLQLDTYSDKHPVEKDSKEEEPFVGAAVGGSGQNRFSLFVGPKDVDILRKVNPRLEQVVDWGWFQLLAKPLFLTLNWTNDKLIRNYGWSIIVITVVINFVMLPLKFSSMKSMKKMQELQPQIQAINAKYKNIGMRDPRKAQQNQEMMDLYKKAGVNPLGGCVPMLLQLPFFIAFYKVLSVAIELRGAPWLWVRDLSQPEHLPIKVLPLVMIASQFYLQRMTPTASPDPQQQRIMMLMPLMLGFMFYQASSGLVLYWLTGNLVGILQQWVINRMGPAPAAVPTPAPKKKGSRK